MKKWIRIAICVVLVLVIIYAAVRLIGELQDYRQADKIQAGVNELISDFTAPEKPSEAAEPDDAPETETPEVTQPEAPHDSVYDEYAIDFDKLSETNPDLFAWLYIPDTEISYPVAKSADNSDYLTKAYDGQYSIAGCLFSDYRLKGDFADRNTIIYGHNMKNGTMFGGLKLYDEEYLKTHKYIYVFTAEGCRKYEIFSVHVTDYVGECYTVGFSTTEAYVDFLSLMVSQSSIDTGVTPQYDDYVLTLSTCTSSRRSERRVVQAVLVDEYLK